MDQHCDITCELSEVVDIQCSLSDPIVIGAAITIPEHINDYYDGTYEVIPDAQHEVILETKQKIMLDDVTVKKFLIMKHPMNLDILFTLQVRYKNMGKNKIIYGGNVLIDLTADTVTESDVLAGKTFHLNSGEIGTGTCEYDSDTSDDNALVAEVLSGRTFHARGAALEGTMTNNGAVAGIISDVDDVYTVPQGFHDGSGTVQISATEAAKLKNHSNIKNGVTILGETGTYSGEAASVQSKEVTPSTSQQVILPDAGYDYLSQVTVKAISYVETANAYGTTVTIG